LADVAAPNKKRAACRACWAARRTTTWRGAWPLRNRGGYVL